MCAEIRTCSEELKQNNVNKITHNTSFNVSHKEIDVGILFPPDDLSQHRKTPALTFGILLLLIPGEFIQHWKTQYAQWAKNVMIIICEISYWPKLNSLIQSVN